MLVRRVVAGVFAVVAVLAGPLPAAAEVLPPDGAPRVLDPRPASGEMVTSGTVTVGARVLGSEPLGTVVVRVDGRDVGTSTPGTRRATPAAVEATVRAATVLAPGDHVAQVLVDGQVLRAWRFTVSGLDVTRLQGDDRVATAAEISRDCYRVDGTADAAVLARVDDFAGALAGTALAGAVNGPLLLTGGETLEYSLAAELRRALPPGADVILLGDGAAIAEELEADLAVLGFAPQRIAGADSGETAAAAAELVRPSDGSVAGTVVIAARDGIEDALALTAPAAARGWPILLTGADALDPATRAYLEAAPPAEIVIAGGPEAIATPVLQELRAITDRGSRLRGAQAVAERFFNQPEVLAVASEDDVALALAGGVHAAASDAPLLLVPGDLPDPLAAAVAAAPPRRVVVYGDAGDVSERVVGELRRTVANRDGPRISSMTPAPGTTVRALEQVVVRFDRRVLPAHSTLSVWIDGHEVTGTLTAAAPEVLALAVEFPSLIPGRRYDVRVVGAATDGEHWVHIDEILRTRG